MEIQLKTTRLITIQGDITRQETDAIVNAANSSLMGGGGVDGAIHRVGGPSILAECKEIIARQGRLPPGQAVITSGGNLPSKYIIHTVGPVWQGGQSGEDRLLAGAYRECLRLADNRKLTSLAFPSISTGAYGYPIELAADLAVQTVKDYLLNSSSSLKEIVFVLFDTSTYGRFSEALKKSA
jgi:O-acetyl-ADP-ribose deacetylase